MSTFDQQFERAMVAPGGGKPPMKEKEARALGAAFRSAGNARMFDLEPQRSGFSDANGRMIDRLVQAWYDGWDDKPAGGTPRKPTIYEALARKLDREPTGSELKAEVKRIMQEALVEAASKGKLSHQKKRR